MKKYLWIIMIGALAIGGGFAWSQASGAEETSSVCACPCGAECACTDCSKDANCTCKANDGTCAPRGGSCRPSPMGAVAAASKVV